MSEKQPCANTDKEIWREKPGDYYSDSIHVTEGGGIGINCGGYIVTLPVRKWNELGMSYSRTQEGVQIDPAPQDGEVKRVLAYIERCGHLPDCITTSLEPYCQCGREETLALLRSSRGKTGER